MSGGLDSAGLERHHPGTHAIQQRSIVAYDQEPDPPLFDDVEKKPPYLGLCDGVEHGRGFVGDFAT